MTRKKIIVIKIGGSTLGKSETTIEDLVTLQKRKIPVVVIHGGGKTVTDWLGRLNITTSFIQGFRVTDLETLKVTTAVLAGLVNKELVSEIWRLGGKAVGLSGADGGMVRSRNKNRQLGYTGEELKVDTTLLKSILDNGYIPVVAPVSLRIPERPSDDTNLLNINGDTAAAEIAIALNAEKLLFLTDVSGLYDINKKLISKLNANDAKEMIDTGVATNGMVAKLKASLLASKKVSITRIIDGRVAHVLIDEADGKESGTEIG